MILNQSRKHDLLVITVSGKIDNQSVRVFEEQILSYVHGGERNILVDLGGCDFINSSGLRVFLLALKSMEQTNGWLGISGLNPYIREVFLIAGFGKIFRLFASEQDELSLRAPVEHVRYAVEGPPDGVGTAQVASRHRVRGEGRGHELA